MGKFNEMLRTLRMRENMSQAELAERLGISKSAIGMYELGKREPDFETLEAIASLFDVDMNYLLGGGSGAGEYYINDDARDMAQFLYDNPEYKVLFDASRNVRKEDISFVKQMLDRLRNND